MRAAAAALLLALAAPAFGAAGGVLRFLEGGEDARAAAMGRTGIASADERDSGALNPAALCEVAAQVAGFTYQRIDDGAAQGAAFYAFPLEKAGTFAMEYRGMDYGDISGASVDGFRRGSVEASDALIRLAWSARRDGFVPGIGLKVFRESLGDASAAGQALDAGLLYRPPARYGPGSFWSRLTFGAAVRNVGQAVSFEEADEPLPLAWTAGLAHQSLADALTLSAEAEKRRGDSFEARAGLELWLKSQLALRLGWRQGQDAGPGISGGMGLQTGGARLDYAFTPMDDLGDVHRVTLSFRFGRGLLDRYYQEGLQRMREGNYAEAVLLFDKALLIDRTSRKVLIKAREAVKKMREAAGR